MLRAVRRKLREERVPRCCARADQPDTGRSSGPGTSVGLSSATEGLVQRAPKKPASNPARGRCQRAPYAASTPLNTPSPTRAAPVSASTRSPVSRHPAQAKPFSLLGLPRLLRPTSPPPAPPVVPPVLPCPDLSGMSRKGGPAREAVDPPSSCSTGVPGGFGRRRVGASVPLGTDHQDGTRRREQAGRHGGLLSLRGPAARRGGRSRGSHAAHDAAAAPAGAGP